MINITVITTWLVYYQNPFNLYRKCYIVGGYTILGMIFPVRQTST